MDAIRARRFCITRACRDHSRLASRRRHDAYVFVTNEKVATELCRRCSSSLTRSALHIRARVAKRGFTRRTRVHVTERDLLIRAATASTPSRDRPRRLLVIHRISSDRERACDLFSESSVRLRADSANAGVDGLHDIGDSRGTNGRTNRDRVVTAGDADVATGHATNIATPIATTTSGRQSSE